MKPDHPRAPEALALSARLRAARAEQRRADRALALGLLEMKDRGLHRALGYASVADYAAAVLDLGARVTRDLLRLARKLPELPKLDAALASGTLDLSKAREIVRVATGATEEAWIERATGLSSRELEREVAAAAVGEPPPTGEPTPTRAPQRVRVSFELEAQDRAVLLDGLAILRARAGLDAEELDDGALLAAAVRAAVAAVEAEAPPTGERYTVVLEHCPDCGETSTPSAEVSDTVAAEAACDAVVVEMRPGPAQGHATRAIPPALRRAVLHRAGWRCEVPGCGNRLWLDVHHDFAWSKGGRHDEQRLVVLCSAHHRAVHAGGLGLELVEGRVVVTHGDGRRRVGRPRAHVGHATGRAPGAGVDHRDPGRRPPTARATGAPHDSPAEGA